MSGAEGDGEGDGEGARTVAVRLLQLLGAVEDLGDDPGGMG